MVPLEPGRRPGDRLDVVLVVPLLDTYAPAGGALPALRGEAVSRGDGRALDKAALAVYEYDTTKRGKRRFFEGFRAHYERQANAAISAYLDALLSELPEAAVEAMMESGGRGSTNTTRQLCERWLAAALLSLRSSSRGANR